MNSLIFNVGLILLTSLGVVQFCTKAFDIFASETAILNLFGTQIERIDGVSYLYSAFVVVFLVFSLLGFLWATFFKSAEVKRHQKDLES